MSFTSLIPSFLPDGISSRFDFQALLDQRGRLLQVHTALPTLALIPERMVMREAVSQPFELLIDCLSTSAHFELKQLVGEQVSVGLLQPTGQYKPWHGYVFEAAQLGADGALARYRLVLKPWICCLEHSLNSRVFESKTARDIIEEVFAAYTEAQFRFEVTDTLRLRSTCTQYRESDLEFVQRLLTEEGLSYHFEHAADGAELMGASSALHTLVITDRTAPRPNLGTTRFAAQHPTAFIQGQKDAVTAFKTQRRLQPNAVALGSWNYRELVGSSATLATALEQGDLPTLEVYDGSGAYRYENTAHAQRATELALGALELQAKTFEGQGSTRHFEAGRQFNLVDHPLYGAGLTAGLSEGLGGVIKAVLDGPATLLGAREDNRFTLLAVEHHAANNLGSEAAALLGLSAIERGSYRNQFHAAPAAAPVLPRFARKPTAPGAQTALVVGLDGEALNTDRDHRVKVRFYWQRDDDGGSAPGRPKSIAPPRGGDAEGVSGALSGTWVRVMSPQAGANWGAVFTPRIGTEVLVEFIEGDIDRPVITAALYNGQDRPPFSAGVDSGVNHPGTLSGIHSHSLDQSGFNQWVLDDATAQVRMRLLCSYSAAEVGLGHLIQQAAHTAQRGAWRGSGFEAATRAWASVRSAKGLLITTTARPGSYGSAQSTQMDATEAVAQLKGAQDLAERLSQAAQTGQAQALTAHTESIPALIKTLDPEQDGKLTQAVNGQEAQKAQGRDLSDPVEAPATPTITLDSPSSQAWLSDASIASYAGQDLARVSQGDQHETAAHTHATVAGQTVSLYTHAGGITAHAANGPVSLRAHTDELQILADRDVTILSVNGEIHINAQSKIELIGADSGVILDGGDITFVTPGTWEAKGAGQAMLGGASGTAVLPELPSQRVAALGLQPGQLQSTFARDQLQRFAQEADEASFVIEMASIFGVDVPLSAYQRLYQEAQAGLRLPPYKIGFGGDAEYDAAQDCFWVDESLACRAARNEPRAAWQLLQALLQAWGQYVAHQLRAVWSQQGSAPVTQAYALALLNLSEATSTTFAELKHPEISGPIVVQHSEPRRVARLQTQHYQDATQAAQADGVMMHDGVYRPERDGGFKVVPVFDAKMMKDDPQHGVHNHHTIEQVLIHPELFNSEEVGYIYYGNWLRDWSQMCDSFMLPPGVKGMGLSREHITTAVMLMGQVVATTYFKGGAWDKARRFIEFKKANLQQCMQRLGCYRPEEHMDNPAGLPDSRQHRFPSGWLVDLPVDKRVLEVNPATGLRRYIGDVDQTGAYPSSLVYMQRQLAIACRLGRTPEGLMHLGFALHVLEDYFAHTNFVELALVKAGSPKVVAWVPEHPDLLQRPITTGQFTTQDIYYSLTYKLSDLLLPASQTNERMGKLHYDGLELADWVVWALLTDAGRTWTAAAFKANCLVMYQAAELAKGAVPEVVQKGVAQARNWAYGYVAAGLKTQVAGRVRAAQIDHYDFVTSMDPTHTMLAKDANDHPLHDLAATLAREAVADVGWCIHRFWQSQGSSADVLACASKYFAHPAKSTLFDKFVTDWRDAHKDRVAAASSRSKALERAKEHQHGGHHDEHRHLPQQFDQMWAFSGQHYAQLFGRDDVTGGLDAGDFA